MKSSIQENFIKKRQKMFATVGNVFELGEFIDNNMDLFIKNPAVIKDKNMSDFIVAIKIHSLEWDLMVSNSHSAPIGFPQNFGNKPGIPKCYPGWRGRIDISYNDKINHNCFLCDCLADTGINSGTGGAGHYELKLFAHDFKLMAFNHFVSSVHYLTKPIGKNMHYASEYVSEFASTFQFFKFIRENPEFNFDSEVLKKSFNDLHDYLHTMDFPSWQKSLKTELEKEMLMEKINLEVCQNDLPSSMKKKI